MQNNTEKGSSMVVGFIVRGGGLDGFWSPNNGEVNFAPPPLLDMKWLVQSVCMCVCLCDWVNIALGLYVYVVLFVFACYRDCAPTFSVICLF